MTSQFECHLALTASNRLCTTGPSPNPKNFSPKLKSDSYGSTNRISGDLRRLDFGLDRVNEHGRINLIERPCGTVLDLLEYFLNDLGSRFHRHRCATFLNDMGGNFTRGQAL